MNKIVVVGLDGFPYSLAKRLVEEGVMCNLASLLREGKLEQMDSIYPTVSNVAWASFQTGKNPGKFGIYGFAELTPDLNLYIPNATHLKSETTWEIASRYKKRVISLGVPSTFPPRPVNGIMVGGFLSPSLEKAVYPPGALTQLRQTEYRIDIDPVKARQSLDYFKEENLKVFEGRVRTLFSLWDLEIWDLFTIHFMDTDRINHFMYRFWDSGESANINFRYFVDFYRKIDDMIGRIRDKLDDNVALIILSDHGFCRLKKEVQLNRWLQEEKYLRFSRSPAHDLDFEAISPGAKAFSLVPGRIYILKKNRWLKGRVTEDGYEGVREEIISSLGNFRDSDGQVICRKIFRKEEVFSGPYLELAPDIVIDPADGYDLKAGLKKEEIFCAGPISGMHTYSDALLYIRGQNSYRRRPVIYDVPATILEMLNIPIPEDFDGVSLLRKDS